MSTSTMSEDLNTILNKVVSIRQKITQSRNGPWTIKLTQGYQRKMFVNQKVADINYKVDFQAVREFLDTFYTNEKNAADLIQEAMSPSQDYIQDSFKKIKEGFAALTSNPSALSSVSSYTQTLAETSGQVSKIQSAINNYKTLMAQHVSDFNKLDQLIPQSINSVETDLKQYLSTQPVNSEAAITQFLGFAQQLKNTIATVKSIYLDEIPALFNQSHNTVSTSLNLINNLITETKKASANQDLSPLLSHEEINKGLALL